MQSHYHPSYTTFPDHVTAQQQRGDTAATPSCTATRAPPSSSCSSAGSAPAAGSCSAPHPARALQLCRRRARPISEPARPTCSARQPHFRAPRSREEGRRVRAGAAHEKGRGLLVRGRGPGGGAAALGAPFGTVRAGGRGSPRQPSRPPAHRSKHQSS